MAELSQGRHHCEPPEMVHLGHFSFLGLSKINLDQYLIGEFCTLDIFWPNLKNAKLPSHHNPPFDQGQDNYGQGHYGDRSTVIVDVQK